MFYICPNGRLKDAALRTERCLGRAAGCNYWGSISFLSSNRKMTGIFRDSVGGWFPREKKCHSFCAVWCIRPSHHPLATVVIFWGVAGGPEQTPAESGREMGGEETNQQQSVVTQHAACPGQWEEAGGKQRRKGRSLQTANRKINVQHTAPPVALWSCVCCHLVWKVNILQCSWMQHVHNCSLDVSLFPEWT